MYQSPYAEHLIGAGLAHQTVRAYVRWIARSEAWANDQNLDLVKLTPSQTRTMATAVAKNTNACRGQLAAALRHYWEMHDRYDGPSRAIPTPSAPQMVCKAIEADEARALVEVSLGWWPHGTAVLSALAIGLRRSEVAQMEWQRFDEAGEWYTVTGKGAKTATLPVHPVLADQLAWHRRPSGWVFPGRLDGHVSPATIWAWIVEVGEKVGIERLRPHQLRHTALATMNDVTGDLRAVQTFARHSRPETTSGYTRTRSARLRQLSDALDYFNDPPAAA